ncbi:hypothetical protein HOP50_09g54890 [Chloropicon primus]|nr:hypothetical protein HOP50_09g54890 [Chloropicon primus]
MDMDAECLQSFVTGSTTTTEEERGSEEDIGGAGSSLQPESESAQVLMTMMRDNARPTKTPKRKSRLRDIVHRVLQDAGRSLRPKEILRRIQAKKLFVFKKRDGSVSTDDEAMRATVSGACRHSPCIVRTAYGIYAVAKESLNGSNAQDVKAPSPLRDAIYRVLQDAGGSLRTQDIFARIKAKKLHVFRRRDGSVSTDIKKMRASVTVTCSKCPRVVRIERGLYAISKEYLNGSTADKLSEEDSNDNSNSSIES